MTLDINPVVPTDRQLIQAYGDGGFKVTGVAHTGSIIVFANETLGWDATSVDDVSIDALSGVIGRKDEIDILLVGCGETFAAVPKGFRQALKEHDIILEWMDSGAAARTFNVLVAEERRVAAAILAVD